MFLVISLLIFSKPIETKAGTIYNAGASNPANLVFYGANCWSTAGYWNLANNTDIPDGATVYVIQVYYSQNYHYTDLKVALFDGSNNCHYITSGSNVAGFVGKLAKQNWYTQCYAKYQGWITPVLRINWNAPASNITPALTGETTLLSDGSSQTVISSNKHDPGTLGASLPEGITQEMLKEAIAKTLNSVN